MASTEAKTETDKSTGNVSKGPTAGNDPKTETGVPSNTNTTAKSAGNVSEFPTTGSGPKNEKDVSPNSAPKSTGNTSEAPKAGTEPKTETDAPPTNAPKSPVKPPKIRTVDVSNISLKVNKKDIWEFFNFSGDIHYIEMKSQSETTQRAYVTFKDTQGAETAVLLTGATIADLAVKVTLVENYQLPPDAPPLKAETPDTTTTEEVVQKAEEVVTTMLAKGFVLGKDALQKAKSFDEKHQVTTIASAKVADLDRKMGLSQKIKEVNEKYQVSEKTQSAMAVAEQKANTASTALMSNPYVSSGAMWVSGAFAAITSKTLEKVEKEEKERSDLNTINKEITEKEKEKSNTVNKGDESSVVKEKDPPVAKPSNESNKVPDK